MLTNKLRLGLTSIGVVVGFTIHMVAVNIAVQQHQEAALALKESNSDIEFGTISPLEVTLVDIPELRPPAPLQFVTTEEATEEWRAHQHSVKGNSHTKAVSMRLMQSIYYPPSNKLGNKNDGYIMVAVLSCCDSWPITKALLESITAMSDPVHLVVIDDASEDGAPEKAAAMGYPVLGLQKNGGATQGMNRAWQYFTAHPELQSLWVLNNDILVSEGAFTNLHRCAMTMPTPGIVGPMSNSDGLGEGLSAQNSEHRSNRHFYGGEKVPPEIRTGLPGTLGQYNAWMNEKLGETLPADAPHYNKVHDILGFFMGFRKDMPIADFTDNIMLRGGRNLHQEYWLFFTWRLDAYVCLDVFAYHLKAATLVVHADGSRHVDAKPTEEDKKKK